MQKDQKERLQSLCEAASKEHDSDKLLELVREINRLVAETSNQYGNGASKSKASP